MKQISALLVGLLGSIVFNTSVVFSAVEPEVLMLPLEGDLSVHDPAIIREGDTYYVFCTGGRWRGGLLPIRTSKDLCHWERGGSVFDEVPSWVSTEIPGVRGIWAPDISYFNNQYHLYYSVSRFGRNDSAIGLAVNKTLNPADPNYKWIDKGLVVRSTQGQDNWNAIDGNIVIENMDKVWLNWGSFWSGIKMKRIDPKTGKLSTKDTTLYSLARRPSPGAVEAPFIIRHEELWYLFVSFDFCCRGVNSTYRIMVGRSEQVTGPYVDKEGTPMMEGGGTLVIEATTENWKGPGHCAILQDRTDDYLVFHAYHGRTGRAELKISTLVWKDGWPKAAPLP
ncbi:MAG: arabinan endo-1,5-alpha-L-arabinosidase [Sedimentisphaerales bacterium]|nr:arabinan endo-1,5-alpha-L-arabinosidase [Sedimentisphaerales bacterium]